MEAHDDDVAEPDLRGYLDLTHRAWAHLDSAVWRMSRKLLILDVSYNALVEFPAELGDLTLLRELHCSFNKLERLPPEIGQLKRLKKIVCKGNLLQQLPADIGRCDNLEELILSENRLIGLPREVTNLTALRVLRLQGNMLRSLPCDLAGIATIEEIDLTGNMELEMIPQELRANTQSIMWILKLHRDYRIQIEQLEKLKEDLEGHTRYAEETQLQYRDVMEELKRERNILLRDMNNQNFCVKMCMKRTKLDDSPSSGCVIS